MFATSRSSIFVIIAAAILILSVGFSVVSAHLHQRYQNKVKSLESDIKIRRFARMLQNHSEDLRRELTASSRIQTGAELSVCFDRVLTLLNESDRLPLDRQEQELAWRFQQAIASARQGLIDGQSIERVIEFLDTEAFVILRQIRDLTGDNLADSFAAHRKSTESITRTFLAMGVAGVATGLIIGVIASRAWRRRLADLSNRISATAGMLGAEDDSVFRATEGDPMRSIQHKVAKVANYAEQTVRRIRQQEKDIARAEQLATFGRVAASIAHELRNPLTLIKTLVQVNLEQTNPAGMPRTDLEVVAEEIQRMESRVQNLIDCARPPAVRPQRMRLEHRIRNALVLLQGRAERQNAKLQFICPDRQIFINGDPEQIQQVIINLVINALDVTPSGQSVRLQLTDDGVARLEVQDAGPGIPLEILPQIFEPFVSNKPQGLGLGLAVTHRIVVAHGGRIEAVNQPDGGSCFIVELPLADDSCPNDAALSGAATHQATGKPSVPPAQHARSVGAQASFV